MIQKLQKLFHLDKWWGKMIFIIIFYSLFWFIFYGSWLFVSKDWYIEYDIYGFFIRIWFLFLYIIIPVLTFFFFPKLVKKITNIKHSFLINSIFIFISLLIFIYIEIIISIQHIFN
jgi:hypothetical protein